MNTNLIISEDTADGLSILPVAQQVIGLVTIIAAIINIWKEVQEQQKEIPLPRSSKSSYQAGWKRNNRSSMQAESKIEKYQNEIVLGLIRFTPIVGTIYSIYKWQKTL